MKSGNLLQRPKYTGQITKRTQKEITGAFNNLKLKVFQTLHPTSLRQTKKENNRGKSYLGEDKGKPLTALKEL